ncbi:hypothetical protein ACTG2V_00080 [Aeromonas sp. 74A]
MNLPDEFLPLAEEMGDDRSAWPADVEQGCAQLAQWRTAQPDMVLSINLSAAAVPVIRRSVSGSLPASLAMVSRPVSWSWRSPKGY